jgi:hypothetical protein
MGGVKSARLVLAGGEQRISQPLGHGVAEDRDVVAGNKARFGALGEHAGSLRQMRTDARVGHGKEHAEKEGLNDEIADDRGCKRNRPVDQEGSGFGGLASRVAECTHR